MNGIEKVSATPKIVVTKENDSRAEYHAKLEAWANAASGEGRSDWISPILDAYDAAAHADPQSMVTLNLSLSKFTTIPPLFSGLIILYLTGSCLSDISGCLPSTLRALTLSSPHMTALPDDMALQLPNLRHLDIYDLPIKTLPRLPDSLSVLYIKSTIEALPDIMPSSLKKWRISHNATLPINFAALLAQCPNLNLFDMPGIPFCQFNFTNAAERQLKAFFLAAPGATDEPQTFVADDTIFHTFCQSWETNLNNVFFGKAALSPRTQIGQILITELMMLVSERFKLANAKTAPEKLLVLDTIFGELAQYPEQMRKLLGYPDVKSRVVSLIRLEIERYTFAVNASCTPFFSAMTNPAKDVCRLVIDGMFKNKGDHYFDNEHGFGQAALRALNKMISTLGEKLTSSSLCDLHDAAVDQVFNTDGRLMQKGYRAYKVEFGLVSGMNCSLEGLTEFKQSTKHNNGWIKIIDDIFLKASFPDAVYNASTKAGNSWNYLRECCQNKVAEIIATYYDALIDAKKSQHPEMAVMNAIVTCAQDIVQYHLFPDGNVRTALLVLNKLLIENGFSPVAMDNPNVLDMHSRAQLIELVWEAQRNFAKLCTGHFAIQ